MEHNSASLQQVEDTTHLLGALAQAERFRGECAPNPAVGAVIVKNGVVQAKEAHRGYGFKHAEVLAIQSVTQEVTCAATLYVTLEPCCHHGKQPPCVDAIIEAGFARVVYAYMDPNPVVSGKAKALLAEHDIICEHLPVEAIDKFYQSYHYWHETKRPFVTAKIAISLDGKISHADGQPAALTDKLSQQFTHKKRKQSDAILTTARTVKNDDPSLNVRLDSITQAKSLYVLDRTLMLSDTHKIFQTAKDLTFFHEGSQSGISSKKVRCVTVGHNDEGLALQDVLVEIGKDGRHDLWLELGGKALSNFLAEGLVNRLYVLVAPKIMLEGQAAFYMQELLSTAKSKSWVALGEDACLEVEF